MLIFIRNKFRTVRQLVPAGSFDVMDNPMVAPSLSISSTASRRTADGFPAGGRIATWGPGHVRERWARHELRKFSQSDGSSCGTHGVWRFAGTGSRRVRLNPKLPSLCASVAYCIWCEYVMVCVRGAVSPSVTMRGLGFSGPGMLAGAGGRGSRSAGAMPLPGFLTCGVAEAVH
jgi:hypothetical protein